MSAAERPRLFPPAWNADIYGGRDPLGAFNRELQDVATIALERARRTLALAEAVYRLRRVFCDAHGPRGELQLFASGRCRSRQAERRIDTLYARILRLSALSEQGILAL